MKYSYIGSSLTRPFWIYSSLVFLEIAISSCTPNDRTLPSREDDFIYSNYQTDARTRSLYTFDDGTYSDSEQMDQLIVMNPNQGQLSMKNGALEVAIARAPSSIEEPMSLWLLDPTKISDFFVSIDILATEWDRNPNQSYVLGGRLVDGEIDGKWTGYILSLVTKEPLSIEKDPLRLEDGAAVFGIQRITKGQPIVENGKNQFVATEYQTFNIRVPGWQKDKKYRMIFKGSGENLIGSIYEIDNRGVAQHDGQPLINLVSHTDLKEFPLQPGYTGFQLTSSPKVNHNVDLNHLYVTIDNLVSATLDGPLTNPLPKVLVNGRAGRVGIGRNYESSVEISVKNILHDENGSAIKGRVFHYLMSDTPGFAPSFPGATPNPSALNYMISGQGPADFNQSYSETDYPESVFDGILTNIPSLSHDLFPSNQTLPPLGSAMLVVLSISIDEGDGKYGTPYTSLVEISIMDE